MPIDSTAELLFRINADSSDATGNIQRFRSLLSKDLSDLKGEFGQWSQSVFGDLKTFGGAMNAGLAGVAAGAVVLGAGLFAAAEKAAAYGSKVFEASEKTGLSTQSLSGLMAVTKLTGENFDSLTMALGRAGRNLQIAIQKPGDEATSVLARVMGSAKNLTELGLKPMDERIQILLQRIFALNDVGERNMALQALLGRGWMTNVETLKLLAEQGYGPAIEKAKQLGIFFSEAAARQAKQFEIAIKGLHAELAAFTNQIGSATIPYMARLIEAFDVWWQVLRQSPLRATTLAVYELGNSILVASSWAISAIPGLKKLGQANMEYWVQQAHNFEKVMGYNEILERHKKLIEDLTRAMDKTEGGKLLPPPEKLKEVNEGFEHLTQMLLRVRTELAGQDETGQKIIADMIRLQTETVLAAEKLEKLRAAGKVDPGVYEREVAALRALVPLINQLAGARQRNRIEKETEEQEAAIEALQKRLESLQEQTYQHRETAIAREMQQLRRKYTLEGNYTEEAEQNIADMERLSLAKIENERANAFAQGLVNLQRDLAEMVMTEMSARKRLDFIYEQDLQRFSDVEKAKQLAIAKPGGEREAIEINFELNREAALRRYHNQLQALHNSTGWRGFFGEEFAAAIRGNEELWREWQQSANQSLMLVRVSLESMNQTLQRAFQNFAKGMAANIAHAIIYKESIGAAMKAALVATLEMIAADSLAHAIYSTALGFLRLAQHNYPAATSAFTAAAIFGAAGIAAAVAGRAIAPGKESAAGREGQAAGSGGGGAGEAATEAQEPRGPRVQIVINGHVIGQAGVEELTDMINEAVKDRDVRLVATQVRQDQRLIR